jgi:hypothetical protein
VTIKLADGAVFPRKGRINFADTRVNPRPAPYEMRADSQRRRALKPGQFARVQLKARMCNMRRGAAGRGTRGRAQGKFVYVTGKDKDGKDIAVVRPWRSETGRVDGANLWIVDRASPGDTVIVDGIAKLQPNGLSHRGDRDGGRRAHRARAGTQRREARRSAQRRRESARREILIGTAAPCSHDSSSTADLRGGDLGVLRARGARGDALAADRAVSGNRAAGRHRAGGLPRGLRADARGDRRGAARKRDQRRAGHDLHELALDGHGVTQIAVTFEIGTNVDDAAINVNNRVKQVEPRLPLEVRRPGRVRRARARRRSCRCSAFYSPDGRYDDLFTSNYVTLNVLDELKRLPGTTNVQIFGAKDYAMRIWVKPDRLSQLKLTPTDVANAINEQNAQFAAGKVGQSPIGGKQDLVYTITTKGRLADPKEFGQIIVRADPDGSIVRLADVAASSSARRTTISSAATTGTTRRSSVFSCRREPTRSRSRRRSGPAPRRWRRSSRKG